MLMKILAITMLRKNSIHYRLISKGFVRHKHVKINDKTIDWTQFKRLIFHALNQTIRFDAWKIRRLNQLNSTMLDRCLFGSTQIQFVEFN